jgi:hypothetical protein
MSQKSWFWCLAMVLLVCWTCDARACGWRRGRSNSSCWVGRCCVYKHSPCYVHRCSPCYVYTSYSTLPSQTHADPDVLPEPKKPALKKIPDPLPQLKAPPGE